MRREKGMRCERLTFPKFAIVTWHVGVASAGFSSLCCYCYCRARDLDSFHSHVFLRVVYVYVLVVDA